MQSATQLIETLWQDYIALNPHAHKVHALLQARGETIENDHIALRTYNDPRVGVDPLAQPFLRLGYTPGGEYHFEEKKLFARHFDPPADGLPRVFISELLLEKFSDDLRKRVAALIDQMPADLPQRDDFPAAGRPWNVTHGDYETLAAESEYAGWMAAFGFCANHFTVLVNALDTFDSLAALNHLLKDAGFSLNTSGGEIKGSPDVLLEQSSTLAERVSVKFADGEHVIPACYYEFAKRYDDPATGKLFTGFVAKSADKIFESTDRRSG